MTTTQPSSGAPPSRFLILEEKPNPSTDYFVLPHLKAINVAGVPIDRLSWGQSLTAGLLEGTNVVLVRYLTVDWKSSIAKHRSKLSGLNYFIDDDIPDVSASRGLPLKYRIKLYCYGTRHVNWLITQGASLWVSAPYLKQKYARYQPFQIDPVQIQSPASRIHVFYHATASHAAEIEWLFPVMKEALAADPLLDFEIIGDKQTLERYRTLPRTTVIHPMSWETYQGFIARPGRHIGLAPFLPSPFNAARSHTKQFDIERAGAVGIYGDSGPWASRIKQHADRQARLLPMQHKEWIATILEIGQSMRQDQLVRPYTSSNLTISSSPR